MSTHRSVRQRIAVAAAAAAVLAFGACADDASETANGRGPAAGPPTTIGPAAGDTLDDTLDDELEPPVKQDETTAPAPEAQLPGAVAGRDLTADDLAGLLWIREEEQLAHDVYVVLGDRWDLRIFENIARSETGHIAAMLELLDRFGVDDPAADNALGTFTDPAMQAMYDDFVEQGGRSLIDALRVGAMIEELDIVDLRQRAESTGVDAIERVYESLERGSRNHLRAFASQLEARNAPYTPTALDAATFDAVVSSPKERGGPGA